MNNKLKVNNKTYARLLGVYLVSLIFLYPYGITVGSNAFRFSDILSVILIFFGILIVFKMKKVTNNIKLIWFILPFFLLEFFLHMIGVIQYPDVSVFSIFRILFLYLPFLFIFLTFRKDDVIALKISFDKYLKLSLILTFIYSLLQLSVLYGFLNDTFLLQSFLQRIAVDPHFNVIDGYRVSGFFNNGIGLSIFGMACFSYFLAKLFNNYKQSYAVYTIMSILLIVFSSTRVALLVAGLLIIINLVCVPTKLIIKFKILSNISIFSILSLLVLNITIGTDVLFQRFLRLGTELGNDYSFSYRINQLWPDAIETAQNLPFGTLVQPYNIVGTIDSGYISYYTQGKWLFIVAMILFLLGTLCYAVFTYNKSNEKWLNLFLFNFGVYIIIEAITHNPMRNALILFFIFFGLIGIIYSTKYNTEKNIDCKDKNNLNI